MKKLLDLILRRKEVFKEGKWLHVFPEGSMWFYYPDIRPLKPAVFKYAVKYDKPIIPITLSFRPRKGLYKLFTNKPLVDLHIGKPIDISQFNDINEAMTTVREKVVDGLSEPLS